MMISLSRLLILGLLLVTLPVQAFAAVSRCACVPASAGAAMAHPVTYPAAYHLAGHSMHSTGGQSNDYQPHETHEGHHEHHAAHTAPHQHKTACASCAACACCTAGIAFVAGAAPFNPALVRHIDFVALSLLHSSAIVDLPERPPRGIRT